MCCEVFNTVVHVVYKSIVVVILYKVYSVELCIMLWLDMVIIWYRLDNVKSAARVVYGIYCYGIMCNGSYCNGNKYYGNRCILCIGYNCNGYYCYGSYCIVNICIV